MKKGNTPTHGSLQHAPRAGTRRRMRPRLRAPHATATIAAIAAICAGSAGGGIAVGSAATTFAASAAKGSPLPGTGDPQIYWTTIKAHLASGLHTTVRKLNQLWGNITVTGPKGRSTPTTTTILDVAIEHGIPQSRLRSIELTAIQAACNVVVHDHRLSTRQANTRMNLIRGWSQPNLDGYSMYAFEQH